MMNQEELKQRLIEIVQAATVEMNYCTSDGIPVVTTEKHIVDEREVLPLVNHLIANGVTIWENEESIEDGTTIGAKNIKFNTGDFARIVGNECDHHFALGTIVQLEKHDSRFRATDVNGCHWWVIDDELEPADVADWEGVKYNA